MTNVVGGLRARLIKESFYQMINDALGDLGWLDTGDWHADVSVQAWAVDDDEEIVPNVVAIADDDQNTFDLEMGSNLSEFRLPFYVDVYAESTAIGQHLSIDIRDFLQGRMASIGRGSPSFSVLDYRMATPTELFTCDLENVELNKAQGWTKSWQKHWYSVYCEIVDEYGDETYG